MSLREYASIASRDSQRDTASRVSSFSQSSKPRKPGNCFKSCAPRLNASAIRSIGSLGNLTLVTAINIRLYPFSQRFLWIRQRGYALVCRACPPAHLSYHVSDGSEGGAEMLAHLL